MYEYYVQAYEHYYSFNINIEIAVADKSKGRQI
jgi:hypothetical protein